MSEQADLSMPAVPAAALRASRAPAAVEPATSPPLLQPLAATERAQLRRALATRGRRAGDLLSRFLLTEVVNGALEANSLDALLLRLVALAARALDAERGAVFLHDRETDELWARVAIGGETAELRTPRKQGIAGLVFASGEAQIVADAYADPHFNAAVDARTGYRTRSLIGVPVRRGDTVLAVIEILNKRRGAFDAADAALLQAIAAQSAIAIDRALRLEEQRREEARDRRLLELSQRIAAESRLDRLLEAIVEAAPRVLEAERATLFLLDPATGELCSRLTAGGGGTIRLPRRVGLAGACVATRRPVNVADAYADPRFYSGIDRRTGFLTRSVLCMPIVDQAGSVAGVLEVLNKRRGHFTAADERRLRAFARQAASALQNAQLLADLLSLKSDGDAVLRAMSDGVVTLDAEFNIRKVNDAARRILGAAEGDWLDGSALARWGDGNPWLREALAYVAETGGSDYRAEVGFVSGGVEIATVNATVARLRGEDGSAGGYSLVLQDITRQKKAHAVVTRYMARQFAERALASQDDAAARATHVATILFSDIRSFTSLTEKLKAQATVDLLNEYFGEMAEIVSQCGGAVDKYLGDGLMAVFGSPAAAAEADAALGAATQMVRRLVDLNRRRAPRATRPLAIGIGLASGEIVTGPVGSKGRTDFTVIGDSVNLAARLEAANKYYGTTILVAGDTVARLARMPRLRRIDVIRAVGKEHPTEIFELLAHHDEASFPGLAALLTVFEAGIGHYRAGDWAQALAHFAEALRIAPRDGPSWVYTDRCLYYRDHPPPDHWDGVWTMQTK